MKKKFLFVIYSIYGGGAEKQMQYILKYIDRNKFEPHLAVFHITGKEKEVVPKDVPIYNLSTRLRPSSFFLIFKLIKLIKKISPDKILSFMWGANLLALVAGVLTNKKVLVSERIYTGIDLKEYSFRWLISLFISKLYNKAYKVVAVTEEVGRNLVVDLGVTEKKIIIIGNAIDINELNYLVSSYTVNINKYVFACGRLEKQKNFSFLVEAMAGIKDYKLVVLGDGSQRKYLERMAVELGVDLILPGYVDNPYPYFKNAKVFVLTSLYEGFPNVILEAWGCGCPIIATDCPWGIRDIIEDGINGLIVPANNPDAMTKAIWEVISDDELRQKLIDNGKRKVLEYDVSRVERKWEELLEVERDTH